MLSSILEKEKASFLGWLSGFSGSVDRDINQS
jgi:hypothetical protein